MRKKAVIYGSFLLSLIFVTGCQTMVYHTNPGRGIYSGTVRAHIVDTIEVSQKAHYMFWGLLPISRPTIQELAEGKLQSGQILANIEIQEQNTFLDGLLAAITYGLYRPRTVTLTGDIYNKEDIKNVQ